MSYCQHELMFLYCCYAQTFLLKIQLFFCVKKVKRLATVTLLYEDKILHLVQNFHFIKISLLHVIEKYSSPVRAKQTHFLSLYLHFQRSLSTFIYVSYVYVLTYRRSFNVYLCIILTFVKFNAFVCQCTTFTYFLHSEINCVCSSVLFYYIYFIFL